jgi:hypothetical protein
MQRGGASVRGGERSEPKKTSFNVIGSAITAVERANT